MITSSSFTTQGVTAYRARDFILGFVFSLAMGALCFLVLYVVCLIELQIRIEQDLFSLSYNFIQGAIGSGLITSCLFTLNIPEIFLLLSPVHCLQTSVNSDLRLSIVGLMGFCHLLFAFV